MLRADFSGKVCVVAGASRGIGRLRRTDFAQRVRQMLLARSPLGRSVPPGDLAAGMAF
jgi:hypothetical protein